MPPETPQNAGYMIAAYVLTAVVLVGYAVALWRRARKTVADLTPPAETPSTHSPPRTRTNY